MVKTALILTQSSDMHAPPVIEEVHRRGVKALCIDLADFPESVSLGAHLAPNIPGWQGSITYQGQTVPLDTIEAIWWRRPQRYHAPEQYELGEREFLEQESYRGIIGILESLEFIGNALWIKGSNG